MKIYPLLLAALVAAPFGVSAQVTVFSDNFSGASTVNSLTPTAPTASSTSYEIIASKKYSPDPTVTSGLKFGLAATTGGGCEVQALFATAPVAMTTAGDYIQLTVTFTNLSGLLAQQGQFGIGMYNSSGSLPWAGGLTNSANNGNTDAAVGGAQNWNGYLALTDWTDNSKHSRVFTRVPQNGPDNRNQVTAVSGNLSTTYGYANPRETGVNSATDTPNLAMVVGGVYADVLTFTLQIDGSIQILNNIYTNDATGTLLSTQTATTTATPLTNSFDAFSMGFRPQGNVIVTLDISSVKVVKFLQAESSCISAAFANTAAMVVGQTNGSVNITIPPGSTTGGPLSVDLVSANPAVAYPGAASGGTLTITFPQNSPSGLTNVPVTVVTTGSSLFYLTNATSSCIQTDAFSSVVNVTCGTVSLTPASISLQTGQTNQLLTITLANGMNNGGPVSVNITNSNPSVATLESYSVTFPQGGLSSTNIRITALSAGTTTFSLTNLVSPGCGILTSTLVTVSCDPITISPTALVSLVGQTSQVVTVSVPAFANQNGAVTVDLKSLNPTIAVPHGAVGGTLALTFPSGGTNNLSVSLDILSTGTATLVLTNNASVVGCSTVPTNGILVITVPQPNGGITNKFETFDTESSAISHGWVEFGSRDNGEGYGFSASANAGGDAGEAGGSFVRWTNRNYYADTNIGGLTLNDPISASGQLAVNPPSLDATFTIGYFNAQDPNGTRNILGLQVADGSYPHQRVSAAVGLANGTSHEIFGPSQLFPPEINTWSFTYDPAGGASGNGRLTLTYNANSTPWSTNVDLSAADRLTGANLNAFGMLVRAPSGLDVTNIMGLYMDNLTYTKGNPAVVAAPTPVPLQVNKAGSTLTFSWSDPSFSLAFATNVQGPYIKIPAVTSPFVTNSIYGSGFFRLVWP